jgi:hypothetical protein
MNWFVFILLSTATEELPGSWQLSCFCCAALTPNNSSALTIMTRQALGIVAKHRLNSQVLTKGCADLIQEDMGLMKDAHTQLGITLCFADDSIRKDWEPGASTVDDRLAVLKAAHKEGIFTWVSLEPVIDPDQALAVIRMAHPYVNFWKVGKLNHMKEYEQTVNWGKFLYDAEELFTKFGAKYYIKNDLRSFALKH